MADSPQDEVYEVEKILGHKIVKKGKKNEILYFIKWLNYEDEDNTWERESNVFAIDLIAQYWAKLPKTSEDRQLFELIQSRKKKPILLPSTNEDDNNVPAQQPQSNKITDLFPKKESDQSKSIAMASSSSPTVTSVSQKQQHLPDIFKTLGSAITSAVTGGSIKGKEKVTGVDTNTKPVAVVKRTPTVVANEDDDFDKSDSEEPTPSYQSTPSVIPIEDEETIEVEIEEDEEEEGEEEKDEILDSEEEDAVTITTSQNHKRTAYSDYFLEQHERKKIKTSDRGNESDSSTISSIASTKSTSKDEFNGNEQVIFDEYYGTEPPMDWEALAIKVEYIGKELPESPIYCTVKWKDGVRSIHPLTLVREKRPDLVIDHFVDLLDKKQSNKKQ